MLTGLSSFRFAILSSLAVGFLWSQSSGLTKDVAGLAQDLESNDPYVYAAAAEELRKIGPAAVRPLVRELVEAKDDNVRRRAADILGDMGAAAKDAVSALASAVVEDRDPHVRSAAAEALGKIGPAAKDAVPVLAKALVKDIFGAREAAADALRKLGPVAKDAIPLITKGLTEDNDPADTLGGRQLVANVVVDLANALRDAHETDSLSILNKAQVDLEKPGFDRESAEARRAVEDLKRDQRDKFSAQLKALFKWMQEHKAIAGGIVLFLAYATWFLVLRFVLLSYCPLTIFRWNEQFATLSYKLPRVLGEDTVPFRNVVLLGLYHYHPRVLEAWVSSHAAQARNNLRSVPAFERCATYVALPVRVNGLTHAELKPEHLQASCAENRWRILLKGEGGLGKTTLAARIAQWALEQNPESRLCRDRRMLPVVLDSTINFDVRKDVPTFKQATRAQLQELITPETQIPEDLFDKLLADRRIVVILDGLTEMAVSPADPSVANARNPEFPANALLITARNEAEDFGPTTIIEPQRIDSNHLLPFINVYLAEAGQVALTDSELFDASRCLAECAKSTGITPLLAFLFAQHLVALQEDRKPTSDLPRNVPDLMLAYVNTLNRDRNQAGFENLEVHKAVKLTAWECLEDTFKPGQAGEKASIRAALRRAGASESLLEYLEDKLKLVKTLVPAETHIQFLIDPLTEYFAALHVVETRAADWQRWREFMTEAQEKAGAPEAIRGFIAAVRDCCMARPTLGVPAWVVAECQRQIRGRQPNEVADSRGA
jgi:HEAT repeat protein